HNVLYSLSLHDALPISTIAFIQKLHGFRDGETIGRDALPQRGHLTRDGVRLGLLLRRHAGVDCYLYRVHECCLLPTCCVCGAHRSEEHTSELQSLTNLV